MRIVFSNSEKSFRIIAIKESAVVCPIKIPRWNEVSSLRRIIFGAIGPNGLRVMVQLMFELKLF